MSLDEKSDLVVVPFNMLPTEQGPDPDPKKIREQKEWILKRITNRPNSELVDDPEAMELMQDLGSDLMINAFACNFRINGKINKDVVSYHRLIRRISRSVITLTVVVQQGEANYLNQRIFQRTSISKVQDKIDDKPIILTSTSLSQKDYKGCLTHFKKRLGLVGDQDLFILVNVTMSPWPTANNFIGKLAQEFQDIAKEEVAKVQSSSHNPLDLAHIQ